MNTNEEKRFIVWDPRDGLAMWGEEGEAMVIISDGLLGRVGEDNVYLSTYAEYPEGKSHRDLSVGACIEGVRFSLSGQRGWYEIHRVK